MTDKPQEFPSFELAVSRFSESMQRAEGAPVDHLEAYSLVANRHLAELREIAEANPAITTGALAVVEASREASESLAWLTEQAEQGYLSEDELPRPPHTEEQIVVAKTVLGLLGLEPDAESAQLPAADPSIPLLEAKAEQKTILETFGPKFFNKQWVCKTDRTQFVVEFDDQNIKMPNGETIHYGAVKTTKQVELLLLFMERAGQRISIDDIKDSGYQSDADREGSALRQRITSARADLLDSLWFEVPQATGKSKHIQFIQSAGRGMYKLFDEPVVEYDPDVHAGALIEGNFPSFANPAERPTSGVKENGTSNEGSNPNEDETAVSPLGAMFTDADRIRIAIDSLGGKCSIDDLFVQVNGREFNTFHDRTLGPLMRSLEDLRDSDGIQIETDNDSLEITISSPRAEIDAETAKEYFNDLTLDIEKFDLSWATPRGERVHVTGVELQALAVLLLNVEPLTIGELAQATKEAPDADRDILRNAVKQGVLWHKGIITKLGSDETDDGTVKFEVTQRDRASLRNVISESQLTEIISHDDASQIDHIGKTNARNGRSHPTAETITDINEHGYTDPTTGEFEMFSLEQSNIWRIISEGEWVHYKIVKESLYGVYVDEETNKELKMTFGQMINMLESAGLVVKGEDDGRPCWRLVPAQ